MTGLVQVGTELRNRTGIQRCSGFLPTAIQLATVDVPGYQREKSGPEPDVVGTRAKALSECPAGEFSVCFLFSESCKPNRCAHDRTIYPSSGSVCVGPVEVARKFGLKWHSANELQGGAEGRHAFSSCCRRSGDLQLELVPVTGELSQEVRPASNGHWQMARTNNSSELRHSVEESLARDVMFRMAPRPEGRLQVIGRLRPLMMDREVAEHRATEVAGCVLQGADTHVAHHIHSERLSALFFLGVAHRGQAMRRQRMLDPTGIRPTRELSTDDVSARLASTETSECCLESPQCTVNLEVGHESNGPANRQGV